MNGTSRSATSISASITVLPVVTIVSGEMFSAMRFARAPGVGARCRLASWAVTRLLISSGYGEYGFDVRSPASTCTTGTRW